MTHHRLYLKRFYLRNNSQNRESILCKIVDLAQEAAQQTDIKFFTPLLSSIQLQNKNWEFKEPHNSREPWVVQKRI
jgi:hypothetical protein